MKCLFDDVERCTQSKCLVWQAVTNTTRSTCKAHNVGIMRVLLPGNEFGAKTCALSTAHGTPARQLSLWGSSVSTRAISHAPHTTLFHSLFPQIAPKILRCSTIFQKKVYSRCRQIATFMGSSECPPHMTSDDAKGIKNELR